MSIHSAAGFRAAALVVALVPPLILSAGCSSGSAGPKPAAVPELSEGSREVRLLWSASLGESGRYAFHPAVAGESVFAASRDGSVARFDAAEGAQRWRVNVERELSAGVGAGARTLAVATEDGEVIALEAADGKVRWRARVSSEVLAPPAIAGGVVIVRSVDSRIFAFAEDTGERRWVYQRAPTSLMLRSPAGVSVAGDTAYAGFSGGKLTAIALANGGVRWEATVALPRGATELERVTDIVGDPALEGREVCVAAYQGRVACYERDSGRQLWARELSSFNGVGVDARYAFVTDVRGAVHAFDRTSGRSAWKQDKLFLRQPSRPAPLGSTIVVGDFEGYVHFLSRDSGAFVARYAARGGAVKAPPAAMGTGVVVQTAGGGLFALAP